MICPLFQLWCVLSLQCVGDCSHSSPQTKRTSERVVLWGGGGIVGKLASVIVSPRRDGPTMFHDRVRLLFVSFGWTCRRQAAVEFLTVATRPRAEPLVESVDCEAVLGGPVQHTFEATHKPNKCHKPLRPQVAATIGCPRCCSVAVQLRVPACLTRHGKVTPQALRHPHLKFLAFSSLLCCWAAVRSAPPNIHTWQAKVLVRLTRSSSPAKQGARSCALHTSSKSIAKCAGLKAWRDNSGAKWSEQPCSRQPMLTAATTCSLLCLYATAWPRPSPMRHLTKALRGAATACSPATLLTTFTKQHGTSARVVLAIDRVASKQTQIRLDTQGGKDGCYTALHQG